MAAERARATLKFDVSDLTRRTTLRQKNTVLKSRVQTIATEQKRRPDLNNRGEWQNATERATSA